MRPGPSRPGVPLRPDAKAATRLADDASDMAAGDPRRIRASLAMFDRVADHWSLRGGERETLLGGVSKSTWSEWRQRPDSARLKADTRERIANLLTIDLHAHSLFAPEFADRWVRSPNTAFGGESPLGTMLGGRVEDIFSVRRYLERVANSSGDERWPLTADRPQHLAVSPLPGEAVLPDDDGGRSGIERPWHAYLEMAAVDIVMRIAAVDATFGAALTTRIAEIAREPLDFAFATDARHMRIASMHHGGAAWDLAFVPLEDQRRLYILSITLKSR